MLHNFVSSTAAILTAALMLVLANIGAEAQAPAPAAKSSTAAAPKAGPGQKVCRHKFPGGEQRTWVCKNEEPCCAWDEIKYVKCGSPVFKCL